MDRWLSRGGCIVLLILVGSSAPAQTRSDDSDTSSDSVPVVQNVFIQDVNDPRTGGGGHVRTKLNPKVLDGMDTRFAREFKKQFKEVYREYQTRRAQQSRKRRREAQRFMERMRNGELPEDPSKIQTSPKNHPSPPFLWLLNKKGQPPVFLFGTNHLSASLQLSEITRLAIRSSEEVYTETKQDRLFGSVESMENWSENPLFTDTPLKRRVDGSTYETVRMFYEDRLGQSAIQTYRFRPLSVLAARAPAQMARKFGIRTASGQGNDQNVANIAEKYGTYQGGLVSTEEEMDSFQSMNEWAKQRWVRLIFQRLNETDTPTLKRELQSAYSSYQSGRPQAIKDGLETVLGRTFVQSALQERSERFFSRIREKLNPGRSQFFAVGVFHLVGPNGLISEFQKWGWDVRRVRNTDRWKQWIGEATIRHRPSRRDPEQFACKSKEQSARRRAKTLVDMMDLCRAGNRSDCTSVSSPFFDALFNRFDNRSSVSVQTDPLVVTIRDVGCAWSENPHHFGLEYRPNQDDPDKGPTVRSIPGTRPDRTPELPDSLKEEHPDLNENERYFDELSEFARTQ